MGMVARLGNLAGIQVKDTAPETRKVIFDLETFNWLVFRQHLFHQMAEPRDVPLVLKQNSSRKRAAHGSRLR